jgi:para-nitrobenzyl esterase
MIDLFAGAGPDAERLAESVQDAWIAFARTGDPSTVALGTWQPFDAGRRSTMVLEPECGLEEAPRHDKLRCWLPA